MSAIEFVLPDGSLKAYSREQDPDTFNGVVVGLGCLGPISSITLDLTPRFNVVQAVYIDITVDSVIEHFRDMVNNVDSFSWLVDWPRGEEQADMSALQGVVRTICQMCVCTCVLIPGKLQESLIMAENTRTAAVFRAAWAQSTACSNIRAT